MLPDRLRNLRLDKKKTQKDMADFLGITRQGYGNYESGKTEPDQKTINALADYFNTSIDYLYGRSDNVQPDLTDQLNHSSSKTKHDEGHEQRADSEANIGRAFLGGSDKYSEEELDLARAAAKAAVDAYRKAQRKRDEQ
ncbi:helix-turn-helix transcriptional regulator [Paenibacillus sp. GSMTC-2017]|nr:helix-turn-helix transcriptional regulator [Paenibacillus sp. GSMTC-2017]